MCMLCGALVGGRHWADSGGGAEDRRRERRVRLRLLNRILGRHELRLTAWGSEGYILAGANLPSQLVTNHGDLWAGVERATGARCDPLDPELISHLTAAAAHPR